MPKTLINTKKEIDEINNDAFVNPSVAGDMEYLLGESLMLFGWQKYRGKRYRPFYGVGVVYRVVKGEKQDMVYIRFGPFDTTKTRLVVLYMNQARRQTLTLKRGQCCQVYGVCRYFKTDIMLNGKETKGVRLGLYATAIQGWYVPTMLDIRRMPTNEDLVSPTEKEQDIMQTFDDVLNEFMTGKEEE